MLKDYFFLAFQNLRHRGLRSWLTILGIVIGIAAVVSLISLGQGLQQTITGQFGTLDPDKLVIENAGTGFGPPGSTVVKKLNDHDLELIDSVAGVEFTIARHIRVVRVEVDDIVRFKGVASLPQDDEKLEVVYDALNGEAEKGRLIKPSDRKKVILGNSFTTEEEFGEEIIVGSEIDIQGETFEVTGILEPTGSFFIDTTLFMLENDLERILNIENEIDLIVVQVEDAEEIERVAENIERRLRQDRDLDEGEEDFSVQTPLQSISGINTILDIINLVVAGIAGIALLIGGIGIANTMYTSVLERTKSIGVMKAIGARNSDILFIFFIESAFLGLMGGIVGAVIGLGIALGISSIASNFLGGVDLGVTLSFPLLLGAISFSFLVGMLAGIIPALQASRLNPVEALRK